MSQSFPRWMKIRRSLSTLKPCGQQRNVQSHGWNKVELYIAKIAVYIVLMLILGDSQWIEEIHHWMTPTPPKGCTYFQRPLIIWSRPWVARRSSPKWSMDAGKWMEKWEDLGDDFLGGWVGDYEDCDALIRSDFNDFWWFLFPSLDWWSKMWKQSGQFFLTLQVSRSLRQFIVFVTKMCVAWTWHLLPFSSPTKTNRRCGDRHHVLQGFQTLSWRSSPRWQQPVCPPTPWDRSRFHGFDVEGGGAKHEVYHYAAANISHLGRIIFGSGRGYVSSQQSISMSLIQ